MKKKILIGMIASAMLLIVTEEISATYEYEELGNVVIEKKDSFAYEKYSFGNEYIYFDKLTGTVAMASYGFPLSAIPSEIDGVTVTAIGNGAFSANTSTDKVLIIPETITKIGDSAFAGIHLLEEVYISQDLESVGFGVFFKCTYLKKVVFGGSVTEFGNSVFSSSQTLETVILPSGMTSLPEATFYNCASLINVTLPDSIEVIELRAFEGCTELREIVLPTGLKRIDQIAFLTCDELTEIILPSGLEEIGSSAFENCYELRQIIIPKSLKTFSSNSFVNCYSLKNVYYEGSELDWSGVTKSNIILAGAGDTTSEQITNGTIISSPFFDNANFNYNTKYEDGVLKISVSSQYSDINTTDWYYDSVDFVVNNGLFQGTSDGSFSPMSNMSNSMIWTVLYRQKVGAEDTTLSTWYEGPMNWISENGYASVNTPNEDMTREELAVMIYKMEGSTKVDTNNSSSFNDSDYISVDAVDAMDWAVSVGLYQGNDANTLNPTGTATRAEVATILMRYLG